MATGVRLPQADPCALTDAEARVAALLDQGVRPVEIARRLALRPKTAQAYADRVREKREAA